MHEYFINIIEQYKRELIICREGYKFTEAKSVDVPDQCWNDVTHVGLVLQCCTWTVQTRGRNNG